MKIPKVLKELIAECFLRNISYTSHTTLLFLLSTSASKLTTESDMTLISPIILTKLHLGKCADYTTKAAKAGNLHVKRSVDR